MVKPVWITEGETLQTKFGPFRHNDIIGHRFGDQLPSLTGRGFVHVLAPSPELWAISLPHRTQIVYSPDASYIVTKLKIKPGSRVIEAGTGSGALTHALARTANGRGGRVYTFEYHRDRFEQALNEFERHQLLETVVPAHRNVCQDGFGTDEINANAVFLDLPAPWLAVPFLLNSGILNRKEVVRICCFSPCIEQVAKTVEVLLQCGFHKVNMAENQSRRWEGHQAMKRTLGEALDVLRDVRKRREVGLARRQRKRAVSEKPEAEWTSEEKQLMNGEFDHPEIYNPWGRGTRVRENDKGFNWEPVSFSEHEIKSHTSYLTFAELPPAIDLANR